MNSIRPHLPLNALRAFEASARHLSFTRAALELHVTQAAVSQQVRMLEERLGTTLFKRLPRGLGMTDESRALLPVLTDAFGRIEGVLKQFEGGHFPRSAYDWRGRDLRSRLAAATAQIISREASLCGTAAVDPQQSGRSRSGGTGFCDSLRRRRLACNTQCHVARCAADRALRTRHCEKAFHTAVIWRRRHCFVRIAPTNGSAGLAQLDSIRGREWSGF